MLTVSMLPLGRTVVTMEIVIVLGVDGPLHRNNATNTKTTKTHFAMLSVSECGRKKAF